MAHEELEWSDKFSTDIVSLDQQHEELIYLSQSLLDTLSDDCAPLPKKQTAFKNLVDHALGHFDYEERIMRNIHYPDYEHHLSEHDDLRKEIGKISESILHGEDVADWKGLVSLVQVWVLRHIVASDTKIREYLRQADMP
ncbi:bacteriohemerythrin [Magnetovibrio blakemorei]|uniref:Hemerythrin-like domain-containing protein n=1 Tax=Magnetovibrio blakemorei TaxID=28181 RepID=A0A1E5QAF1_9PROT|nr:bacteriohemerythrin [Magnetovibrio blakemorei]OEJ68899.1 hypothetical protein BEN30_05155 [Magnetovibrio blakemorei]